MERDFFVMAALLAESCMDGCFVSFVRIEKKRRAAPRVQYTEGFSDYGWRRLGILRSLIVLLPL